MIFKLDAHYFPKQHQHFEPYNGQTLCSLWGTNCVFIYYWVECQSSREL